MRRWEPEVNDQTHETIPDKKQNFKRIVVVGAGPVSIRFINELERLNVNCDVKVFGNEPYELYNRAQLSSILSRQSNYADILQTLPEPTEYFHATLLHRHVSAILPVTNQVKTSEGEYFDYDYLVLATGSKPKLPPIEGINTHGVYTFRNLHDTESLFARSFRSRKMVIVGGGLLGLETARALNRHHTAITVLHKSDRLLNRQLDAKGSALLEAYINSLGIEVITNTEVKKVLGEELVTGLVTNYGKVIECDTIVLCTGVKPEVSIAEAAGLKISYGIQVDDHMRTNHDNIYAIGDCCEHRGVYYGIISAGMEQAIVLAENMAEGSESYQGTNPVTTLKVVGQSVCSMGEIANVSPLSKRRFLSFYNQKSGIYRKLVISKGHLVGASGIGDWDEHLRIQEIFVENQYLPQWRRYLFRLTGRLYWHTSESRVRSWSEAAIVCQCSHVSRGVISEAIDEGCQSVETIGTSTSAGTVCGSCKPLLQSLLDDKPAAVYGILRIFLLSTLAFVAAALFVLVPGVEPADSVQTFSYEFLWTDKFWKQVSGYSIIGLIALALTVSLRKRLGLESLGQLYHWRILHTAFGLLAILVLVIHTGAHLGENLNRWLMINFLVVSAAGALAGVSYSWALKNHSEIALSLRKSWFWVHLLVTWPLPALLIIHILSVYFY